MPPTDDVALLRQFATENSEAAFATLVERYIGLVHSAALRQTNDSHAAEEITQAVFIILARKAGSLTGNGWLRGWLRRPRRSAVEATPRRQDEERRRRGVAATSLAGWLYQTARLTTANYLRTEIRRARREQEAHMQSIVNETESSDEIIWQQIAPLLDIAMGKLNEADRNAIVLRYFENKSMGEIAAALDAPEATVRKRVTRAVERLRKFFTKRGVTLTAAAIAGAVSANSVQAAPVGLVMTITATAAKGTLIGGSTLTLVEGALKIMAWTKAKTAIVASASVLLVAGTATVVVEKINTRMNSVLTQRLDDGSTLVLNRVSFGDKHKFGYGGRTNSWTDPGHDGLVVEFRLITTSGANHPLVKPAFYRQFRYMLRGKEGIEFVGEFSPNQFKQDSGDYYGYITTSVFPRDSKWLWFRIEKSETNNPYGPWQTVAEFKTANPTHSANHTWVANSSPTTNSVDGMNFVLGEVTVEMRPMTPRDIWNHVVTVPTEVFDDGVLLTNWSAMYVHVEDASGNWNSNLQSHRSLDPRFVWKLDMDFQPVSGFADENLATVQLPTGRKTSMTANVMGVPVTISWDGYWIDASIPTNQPNLALQFVSANDDEGEMQDGVGSWGQYRFRKGSFMARRGNGMTMDVKPTKVTIAVVPNVHTTFYTQPKLVVEKVK